MAAAISDEYADDDVPIWLVCPNCHRPDVLIENQTLHSVILWCPSCEHRWSDEEPGAPTH